MFGTQLCKWILIILVNLLRYVSCTFLTWWRNVDVSEITSRTWHRNIATQRNTRAHPPRDNMATKFAGFESNGLQSLGYPSRDVKRCDVKELKERLLREWRLLGHSIIAAAIAHWHTPFSACVRVNGGHFEHKFWTYDFLVCFSFCRYWFP